MKLRHTRRRRHTPEVFQCIIFFYYLYLGWGKTNDQGRVCQPFPGQGHFLPLIQCHSKCLSLSALRHVLYLILSPSSTYTNSEPSFNTNLEVIRGSPLLTHDNRCLSVHPVYVGRDSSVGIASRYWLDGPGIESRWWDFPHPSRQALGPTQPPV